MNNIIDDYLNSPPIEKLKVLEIEIPCSSECIKSSKFKELLRIEGFSQQLEVIDSLKSLIEDRVEVLMRELEMRMPIKVNIDELTFSFYRIVEYGGDFVIGSDTLSFNDRTVIKGNFDEVMKVYKSVEEAKKDDQLVNLCHEIRYLSESLWEHLNKNIRRALNESKSRS
ncbi:hypothetical protein [Stygiolobus caldivivus]|uniref:Uncharacterized protein n=1 Tax=Stygiolobus caldivivus TaxID=2824673 RepID=A0A8D5U4X2_9CREN|nr:hypothetical protein [Stygiolobus caldivivus]BCU69535.1 hypothetical protein KN1_08320 [Stygiolobus caldivivus]